MTRPPTGSTKLSRITKLRSKKRPTRSTVAARRSVRSDSDGALSDLTRPIARDRRLVRGRITRWLIPVTTFGVVIAFGFVLFVRPVQTYFQQDRLIEERTTQYEQIATVIGQLETEVNRLKTPEGIKEAAREQIGYINEGERRVTVNQTGQVPTELPAGWPYSMATQILTTRATEGTGPGAADPGAVSPDEPGSTDATATQAAPSDAGSTSTTSTP